MLADTLALVREAKQGPQTRCFQESESKKELGVGLNPVPLGKDQFLEDPKGFALEKKCQCAGVMDFFTLGRY